MFTVRRQNVVSSSSSKSRLCIYYDKHSLFILSIIILICKIIVLTGLLITIYSNHWAKNPIRSDMYAGYKTRCSVHICLSDNPDPTWLVDLICILAIINLVMELMNISIIWCFHHKLSKIVILLGLMFILTFIITDCGIVFAIHIASYVYKLPMGYAYNCFIFSILFTIIDWGCSLKRFISDWPEMVCLTANEYKPTTLIVPTGYFPTISESDPITPSSSFAYRDSAV